MTETDPSTYYGTAPLDQRVNMAANVNKNDSNTQGSTGEFFENPILSSYLGDVAAVRTNHSRTNLHALYYRDPGPSINLNILYSDDYSGYMAPTGSSTIVGGYSGPLIAGGKKIAFVNGATSMDVTLGTSPVISTTGMDNAVNTQKVYKLRLYDRSVDRTGSGNYSETAFYSIRDNTAPNRGIGLAANDTDAERLLLAFDDNQTVYDTTATAKVSRFFGATTTKTINVKLKDTGIGGSSASDYNLYNAGLQIGADQKIEVEQHNATGSFNTFFSVSDRYTNVAPANPVPDFRNVDLNKAPAPAIGYRRYPTKYSIGTQPDKVCDLVGNCISPSLAFRVTATAINPAKSTASLSTGTTSAGDKIIANGLDGYKMSYILRDAFDNIITPVKSEENANAQIKFVETSVVFQNGLYQDQRTTNGAGNRMVGAIDKETDNAAGYFLAANINTTGKLTMREGITGTLPNATYTVELNSKVPSKQFYPYLSPNAVLRVSAIESMADISTGVNQDVLHPKTGSNRAGSFALASSPAGTATPLVPFAIANTGGLSEDAAFNNITVDTTNYGKVTLNSASGIAFSNLPGRALNLEYGTPFVYGLTGMRILVDGQWAKHYKKIIRFDSANPVSDINVYERNLVAHDTDRDEQGSANPVLSFSIRKTGDTTDMSFTGGAYFTAASPKSDMFPSGTLAGFYDTAYLLNPANQPPVTASGAPFEVQMSSLPTRTYDNNKLRTGFVSALTYFAGANQVILPSVARSIADENKALLTQYDMARAYFAGPANYTLTGGTAATTSLTSVVNDIAITGLTNSRYNALTTDTAGTKASAAMGQELTRTSLVTTIKKRVSTLGAGLAATTSVSGVKKWCSGGTFGQDFLSAGASADACTLDVNGEKISFVRGNTIIDCSSDADNACSVNQRRSIVVLSGSLYIKSNITTLAAGGAQTIGQLFLGVMTDYGIQNADFNRTATQDITNGQFAGWMFIDPKITNIDAFLFSQGTITSWSDGAADGQKFYVKSQLTEEKLRNQLQIMGSMLSLNTIAGSRKTPIDCPYIAMNTNLCKNVNPIVREDTSQIFDLIYLRRYTTTSLKTYTGDPADALTKVPYHPAGQNVAKRAGGATGPITAPNTTDRLRDILDPEYYAYPMLIERDLRWNIKPSTLFVAGN